MNGGVMNDEDFSGIEKKALSSGAKKCYVLDLQEDFVENYVFPVLRSSALYESRYMMGTSLARPCITKTLVRLYKFGTRTALYFFLLPLLSSLSPSSLRPEGCPVQKITFYPPVSVFLLPLELWPLFLIFILHEYNITDSSQAHAPLFPQVAIAKQENCKFVAHGSTGKGNDQALIYIYIESKMHLIDSILFLVLFLMVIALCLTRSYQ